MLPYLLYATLPVAAVVGSLLTWLLIRYKPRLQDVPPSPDPRELLARLSRDIFEAISRVETRVDNLESIARETRSLVGPFGVPLPDGMMLVQTLHGIKLVIDPLDRVMAPNLIIYRQWEPEIARLLATSIDSNTVFVDVGANIGCHSCLAGSIIGRSGTGKVIAIEPNPVCCELLRRNIQLNWSMCPIEVMPIAVSNFKGTANLAIPLHHAPNAHLALSEGDNEGKSTPVAVSTLDQLIPDGIVDIIKIDVEGHEWAVLDGARNLLARSPNPRIVLEWSRAQMDRAGYSPEAFFTLFDELCLAPYRLSSTLQNIGASGVRYERAELEKLDYANLVLARTLPAN